MNASQLWNRTRFQIYTLFLFLISSLLIRQISLTFTDGKLVYGLDDPYIHLALAESIYEGEYGINSGEKASPSSSILYPYILALGFYFTDHPENIPFWISLFAMAVALWLIAGFLWDRMMESDLPFYFGFGLLAGPLLILGLKAPMFPMIGMEHPLHIMTTVMALKGMYDLSGGDRSQLTLASLWIGVVLAPFIRYEGIPLTVGGIGLLFLFRYYRLGFLAALTVAFGLGVVSYLFWKSGLALLPSSVIRKSPFATEVVAQRKDLLDALCMLITRYQDSMCQDQYRLRWATTCNITFFILVLVTLFSKGDLKRYRAFWMIAGMIPVLHEFFGFYGGITRHEAYAEAAILISLFSILPMIKRFLHSLILEIVLIVLMLIVTYPHLGIVFITPWASADIYTQQYQMHRFVTEYFPHPVAINDLGWVSFRNRSYVLDLVGLGSYEITRMYSQKGWDVSEVQKIAQKHGIVFAMIYRHWFGSLPDNWCLMGILKNKSIVSGGPLVHFYLLKPEYRQEMQEALKKWAKTLPHGTKFYPADCVPMSQSHIIEGEVH